MKPLTARGLLSTWSLRGRFLSRLRLCQKTPRARSCLHKQLNHPKTDKRKFKCLSPSSLFPSQPPFRLMSLSSGMSLPRHIGALLRVSPISSVLRGCSRLREFAAAMRCVRLNGITNHWVGRSGATLFAMALASCLSTPLTKPLMPRPRTGGLHPTATKHTSQHQTAWIDEAERRTWFLFEVTRNRG